MKKKLITALLIIGAAITIWLVQENSSNTLNGFETQFGTEDTEQIDRVFIATQSGKSVDLTKQDGIWYVNGNREARKLAVDFMLETLQDLAVHSPVPSKSVENMTRELAARHKKVEIYRNGQDKPFKTLYIGTSNQALSANLCLVETRSKGKADKPYWVMKKGHRGIINPIFFALEKDWLSTEIFEYPNLEFSSLRIDYPADTSRSFEIKKENGDWLVYNTTTNRAIPKEKTNYFLLNEYLERFKMVHFDVINEKFPREKIDSLINSTAVARIEIKPMAGKPKDISLYRMLGYVKDMDGNVVERSGTDLDYFHGWFNNELVKVQRFVFNPLLYVRQDFILQD